MDAGIDGGVQPADAKIINIVLPAAGIHRDVCAVFQHGVISIVYHQNTLCSLKIFRRSQKIASVFIQRDIMAWEKLFEVIQRHVEADHAIGVMVAV